jgi:hypothetical protein
VVQTACYPDDLDPVMVGELQARIAACIEESIAEFGSKDTALRTRVGRDSARVSVEWIGFPERLASCLTRRRSLQLLDAESGSPGGRNVQEEYLEWRVVCDGSSIRRIELTTELPEYWAFLAGCKPERLLELIAEFADEEQLDPDAVFGRANALDREVSAAERERAFRENMLETGTNPYNDGTRAICCMRHQSNTLYSLATLAAAASTPQLVIDSLDRRRRSPNCNESIGLLLAGLAEPGRASDPLLVERFAQLAFEGREVALDWPVGVYMQHVEPGRLFRPDGRRVPQEWFQFSRGCVACDGQRRYQRLIFEVPAELGFAISDLIDTATGRRIEFGGEIADLVGVTLFLRVGERGTSPLPIKPVEVDATIATNKCEELTRLYSSFVQV